MKKTINAITLALLILTAFPSTSAAQENAPGAEIIDLIIMRPAGLIALIGGSVTYAALSPLTAFATISPPHNAFQILAKPLILTPFAFTFDRPLGSMITGGHIIDKR